MSSVFLGILRMEWRYQVRQLAFPLAVIGFAGWAAALIGTGYGPDNAAVNSPYVIMQSMGLVTLPVIFLLTITCTSAALRDVEYRMAELVWSTPAGRLNYLAGRFGGAILAALTALAVATVVLAIAPHFMSLPPERVIATRPLAYLWAFVLIAVPGTLLFGSVIFAVAALTRSNVASYVTGVFLYALYFVTALLIDSPLMANAGPVTPEAMARAAILDPLGLSAFFEQTRYWGAAERNARMIALTGNLVWNRVLWAGMAVGALVLVARRFSFVIRSERSERSERTEGADGLRSRLRLLRPFRHLRLAPELRLLTRNLAFAALLAMWVFVIGMEMATSFTHAEYFTSLYPTTGFLVNVSLLPLSLFGTLALTWFAAEVSWRARAARMADILDATPASPWRFYLARLGALAMLIVVLIALTIVVGVVIQLARGYTVLELPLWLSLFPLAGLPLLLVAVLALLVQSLSPNRWVGLIVSLALLIGLNEARNLSALSHPILRYGATPALEWSDMNGYGAALGNWAWFMGAWALGGIALTLVTVGAWPRGRATLVQRMRRFAPTLGRAGQLALACSAALFLAVAGRIWYSTTVANRFETSDQLAEWKAGYEKAWRHTASEATPVVTALEASLDLHPREQRYTMRGTLTLANRTAKPIDTVRVVTRRDITVRSLGIAGAREVRFDSTYRVATWVMDAPLLPGDSTTLQFDVGFADTGLRADGYDNTIVGNGSFVMSHQVVPSLGYRASYELQSQAGRRQYGLAAASAITPLDTTGTTRAPRNEEWLTLDVTVSTDDDQQVVASGNLVRTWRANGRRYYHYVTPGPVTGRFGFASARYQVERARAGGVEVELYYDPRHRVNVPAMLEAATRSLTYFGREFGPYQFPVLRIAEVPSYLGAGALALPGTIYFVEDRGFMTDARDSTRFDIITRRMAHEVAHQWWGHQLSPADAEGATMLVETLAKYSEQLVLRERRGEKMLEPLLYVDEDRYRRGAADDLEDEPGLYRVADQDYIYYGKGGVVMHQLTDSLGEAALNRSLRTLVERFGGPRTPPPTTLDLLGILHADMPVRQHALIDHSLKDAGLLSLPDR